MKIVMGLTIAAALACALLLIMAVDSVMADLTLKPSYEQVVALDYVAMAPVRHTVTETTLLTFTVAGASDTWAFLSLEFWTPAWPTGTLQHVVPPDVLGRLSAGHPYTYTAGQFVEEGFVGEMGVQSTAPLSLTWSVISRPPTPTPEPNIPDTPCPIGTATPFWVEPVTSPTDRFVQTITVIVSDADLVTVTAESGIFVTDKFANSQALVDIKLLPGVTHHLLVEARIPQRILFGDCEYGGYTRKTTVDMYTNPLWIVQEGWRFYLPAIKR